MPKQIRSLSDMIDNIAFRKRRAATAPVAASEAAIERPREIYVKACEQIASHFSADGFRFHKSKHQIVRDAGDLKFTASFHSSHNNVAGEYVGMWIFANVWSTRLGQWRGANGLSGSDDILVAGGQVGNLIPDHSWLEWNLANPESREGEIQSAVTAVRRLALPYFDRFDDVSKVCARLVMEDDPGMDLRRAFDYLACFCSLAAAREMCVRYLSQWPDLVDRYHKRVGEIERDGLPTWVPTGSVEALAMVSVRYGLGDVAEGQSSGPASA